MDAGTTLVQQAMHCHQTGDTARAAELYEAHLRQYPTDANALHMFGVLQHQSGNQQRAVELIRRATDIDPSRWTYWSNLGAALRAWGRIDEAIKAFERAHQACPDKPEPLNNLGAGYLEKGRCNEARTCLEQALVLSPNHFEAHLNLGGLHEKKSRLDEAVASYTRAIELAPNPTTTYMLRAAIQLRRCQPLDAIADYQHVIAADPTLIAAHVGVARAQMQQQRFDVALETLRGALVLDPESALVHCCIAEILLGRGEHDEGWQEYAWRFRMKGGPARRDFGASDWRGETLADKRLLVYGEQSLADELMFARAVANVLPRVGDCLVECDAALVELFRRSFSSATVHQRDVRDTSWVGEAGMPDYQTAAGSLYGNVMAAESDFDKTAAYLIPDDEKVAGWKRRFARLGPGLNVGLAWKSRDGELNIGRNPDDWGQLLRTPGVNWVGLQPDEAGSSLSECAARWGVELHDWEDSDPLNDVDGLVAQMLALDLVICGDGTLAQLAAACGANAWVLLGQDPNWRWGFDLEQGHERGAVRLFHPPVVEGDRDPWAELVAHIATELAQYQRQTPAVVPDTPELAEVNEATDDQSNRLKKSYATINDADSGLVDASLTEAIKCATKLHAAGQDLKAAERICRLVLEKAPHNAAALYRLGAVLTTLERFEEAVDYAKQAVELHACAPIYHYQLAAAYTGLKQYDEAIEALRRCLTLRPNLAEGYLNLGAVLERSTRLDEALPVCRRAVEMNPQSGQALYNLANVLLPLGKVAETEEAYDRVVQLDPDFAKGHWNRGLCYLVQGKFAEGWPEYEWREAAGEVVIDKFDAPLWDGKSSLEGKFILLHAEQGIGDELMFGTCYRDIIRQAGRVMITCDPRLKDLFRRSFPEAAVVALRRALGDRLTTPAGLDFQIPVGSLPLHLRKRWEDFPGTPYLRPDPEQVAMWRERFDALGPDFKIGISWRAGGVASEQRRRTSPLDHWQPLFRLPGVQFVNLQYGKCAKDLQRAEKEFGVHIHHWDDANPLKDLDAAAAQIAALDMVVSVGNTTIHMAGALGKESWIALPFVPGWRYLLQGEKMPWYGCARLMRQAEDRDWDKLLERMAAELDAHLGLSSGKRRSRPVNVAWPPAPSESSDERSGAAVRSSEPALTKAEEVSHDDTVSTICQAVALHQSNDLAGAERLYRQVLSSQPDCLDALYLMGTVASQSGRTDEAVGLLRRALDVDAARPEIHYNLANALRRADERQQAVSHYRRAIELAPDFALSYLNLGATLEELARPAEALACFDRAVALAPQLPEAHHNRGSMLVSMNRLEEAVGCFQTSLRLKPDYTEAHAHLAGTLRALGRLGEARLSYDAALRLRPDDADTRVNRAMLLLQQGDFEEGWREYEWRWGSTGGPPPRATSLPAWQGESLADKTLLVWGEQGVGDEIMFASCVAEVAANAQHCVLECSPRLVGLFSRSLPGVRVVPAAPRIPGQASDVDRQADVQIAMGSLPRLVRRSLGAFPERESFLVADPQRLEQWRERIAALGPGLKVGISWHSGSDGPDRGQRTIDLAMWRDLIATDDTHFVSLQYGDVEAEIEQFRRETGLKIHHFASAGSGGDFDDLAAEVASLDLVISVANATVHLAAGLGVDTWTLTPMAPSWRWLKGKSTSPWYPRMSVYSQADRGDWAGVLADVRQRLVQRLIDDRRPNDETPPGAPHPHIAAPHVGLSQLAGIAQPSNQAMG